MSDLMPLFSLSGKVAVVIGGGGHICSALSMGYVLAGAQVVVADLRIEKSKQVVSDINSILPDFAIAAEVDASSKSSLTNLLDEATKSFGRVDILVNGAGINSPKAFLDIDESEWHEVVNSQLTATMLGCQVFGSFMTSMKSGSIVNISSASADPALSKAYAYSAAKAGIRNLTQNLGREWAPLGVRVNAIRPGFFPTEWNRKNFITQERETAILNHTPMGRYGDPSELVGAAVFLASDAASFVTGSELVVDGGFSAMTI